MPRVGAHGGVLHHSASRETNRNKTSLTTMTANKMSSVKAFGAVRGWPMFLQALRSQSSPRRAAELPKPPPPRAAPPCRGRRDGPRPPASAATTTPRQTMMELKMSASDSQASAISACEWPKMPATSFAADSKTFDRQPDEGGAQAAFKAVRWHAELLTRNTEMTNFPN